MYRDRGISDEVEIIASVENLTIKRLRMRRNLKVDKLESGRTESLLVPLEGEVEVTPRGELPFKLAKKDTLYLPVGTEFSVESKGAAELIWAQATAEKSHPSYVKRFDSQKVVNSGTAVYKRKVITTVGEGDPAERFIAGFVEGEPGNWTSFPPHKHDGKPEVYIYYGMGKRFGVQLVVGKEDNAYVVRDGDAVAFERGYHPNVATPGVGMNFLWIISADPKSRTLAVEFHPEYKDMPIGATHLSLNQDQRTS